MQERVYIELWRLHRRGNCENFKHPETLSGRFDFLCMAVIFNSKTETQNAAIFNCKTETKNAGADERGRGRSGVARALNAFACSHAGNYGQPGIRRDFAAFAAGGYGN